MSYQHIDLKYLDNIAGEDAQLRTTLLEMVCKELATAVPSIEKSYSRGDWPAFHGAVHQLKSTVAFVGNPELTALNQQLLTELEAGNHEIDYTSPLSRYRRLCRAVTKELEIELKRSSSSSSPTT